MEAPGPARPAPNPPRADGPSRIALRCSCLLLLGLLAAWVVVRLGPPAAVPRAAPAEVFSAGRAREHLEQIARVPHPSGSAAARDVEAYITRTLGALGLEVELQTGPACTEAAGLRRCGHVRNVIGTWRGRAHDGALLLSAHYDSVPNAPGAGDDGAAVAALLEAARIASLRGPLEHDVIFAFLDGEEDLLLGSNQLCPAAELGAGPSLGAGGALRSRVRLVGNFDARGSSGAVTLISATPGSGRAIAELASALEHPVLSSFYPSVARVLPNATDAEVYERCGLETLSFAFAAGFENYHQGTDTPARLDDGSLQHHGDHALALLRRFAEGAFDARDPGASELVFFDVGALFVVRYPYALARGLAAALALGGAFVLRRRLRALGLSLRALLLAAAGFALACLAAAAVGALVIAVVTRGWRPWASYVHAASLAVCALCFVLAALVPLAGWARRRFAPELLTLGPLLVWVALAVVTALALPGTSQLFAWPAAALLCAELLAARRGPERHGTEGHGEPHAAPAIAARALLLVPAVLMITPVIYTLIVVLGAPGASVSMAWAVALLGAGAEPLALLARRPRHAAFMLLALGCLVAVGLIVYVRGEPGPPTPNVVAHAVDSSAGRAVWATPDARRDAFTQQFLGPSPTLGSIPALGSDRLVLMNAAPVVELEPPALELVSDRWVLGERSIELRVRSPRAARSVLVWETGAVRFSDYRFDGAPPLRIVRFSPELDQQLLQLLTGLGERTRWSIQLISPRVEGSTLTLATRHAGALEFMIADRSDGLGVLPPGFAPRSTEWTEGYPGDHTLVSGPRLVLAALPEAPP